MNTEDKLTAELELAPDDDTLGDVLFGDARGARTPERQLSASWVRGLTSEDLPALRAARLAPATREVRLTSQVKHSHHRLAQLIVSGMPGVEISLVTGHTPAYISDIQHDPAFAELLAYYRTQSEQKFADLRERMAALGIATIEELQRRLDDEPEGWSKRELMELAKLTTGGAAPVVRPGEAGPLSPAGVAINVSFVQAQPAPPAPAIDITPEKFK